MIDHIIEYHKEEIKDFDKEKAWYNSEKDFHQIFETETMWSYSLLVICWLVLVYFLSFNLPELEYIISISYMNQ